MLGPILSAFTLLAILKISIDILLSHPDSLPIVIDALIIGSILAASLLFLPI